MNNNDKAYELSERFRMREGESGRAFEAHDGFSHTAADVHAERNAKYQYCPLTLLRPTGPLLMQASIQVRDCWFTRDLAVGGCCKKGLDWAKLE